MAVAAEHLCAPAAGVPSVGPSQPEVTTEFLVSSHFQIGQDNRYSKEGALSVFKKDYPPWEINGKPAGSKPPRPSELMHKDDERIYERTSETRQQYEPKKLDKPVLESAHEKLYGTNFKMERDSAANNFVTTNNAYYTPKEAAQPMALAPTVGTQSHIPQGDQEKAPLPVSDYRDRFQGHDTRTTVVEKAKNLHLTGRPTIRGDDRDHHYTTTHQDQYHSKWLPPIKPFSAPTGTNIPQGDPQKEGPGESEFQTKYQPVDPSALRPYNRGAVSKNLQRTNFNLKDGQGGWQHYVTEMRDNYIPLEGKAAETALRGYRNKSDFPEGDWDAWRNTYRGNMTTNRYYHGKMPAYGKPEVISGAERRTRSKVELGDDVNEYCTTNQDTYKPKQVPYTYNPKSTYTPSVVPLKYYEDEANNPEYFDRFQDPAQGKLVPNEEAIATIRDTHIRPPLGRDMYFLTTNQEAYVPKETTRGGYDPTRLQKSSVPLGTHNTNYFRDACED